MSKAKIIFPSIILFVILVIFCYKFGYLRIRISNDFYIQQKPFTSNFILKSETKGTILEYIYEWKETDNYIYGSVLANDTYYLYEKESDKLNIYNDLHSFYISLDEHNLIYTMDNCSRIMDFRKIY